jgi:Flp pilus assembly pilin Flp
MALLGYLAPLAATTAAEEGKKVIEVMLLVGLIFVAVIALGQLTHWVRHRNH